jgi:Arc/MetJ-type ribon-helix-helix transcriptional regulator
LVIALKYPHAKKIQKRKYTRRIAQKLEKLVESKQAGYVSVSDAVKDAIRELLRKNKLLP